LAVNVQKGTIQSFSAVVTGANNPAQTVTWNVYGNASGDTKISDSGVLTVGVDETKLTLTIVAISTVDTSKSGTAVITVTDSPVAPNITGQTALSLVVGYETTSTGIYAITGTGVVTVTKTSGDAKITWNNETKRLDIASGLAAGTYTVKLKAANGISPDATLTFTLIVLAEGDTGMLGDVDNSGSVTTDDARMALQAALNKISLAEDQEARADVDGSGGVTTDDARLILQYALDKIDCFPAKPCEQHGK
jgi:hypothetical protein